MSKVQDMRAIWASTKSAGTVFRGEMKWVLTSDKMIYKGPSNITNGHFVDVLGEVSVSPSFGEKVTYAARIELALDDEPTRAKSTKMYSFQLKVNPPAMKDLVNNLIADIQEDLGRSLIQVVRRSAK